MCLLIDVDVDIVSFEGFLEVGIIKDFGNCKRDSKNPDCVMFQGFIV